LEKYGVIYPCLMMWREEGVKNTQSKIVGGSVTGPLWALYLSVDHSIKIKIIKKERRDDI